MDLAKLKTEITTDPQALGYVVGNTPDADPALAEIINRRDRKSDEVKITAAELFASIDFDEAAGLTAANRALLAIMLSISGEIAIGQGTNARKWLRKLFPDVAGQPSATMTALRRDSGRLVSRAEEIGLPIVTPTDVYNARVLP